MRSQSPARWKSPFVSGNMVFLMALIALVEPPLDRRTDVKQHVVLPEVTYRIEQRWRVVSDEEIAQQASTVLDGIRDLRKRQSSFHSYRKETWWITKQCKSAWTSMRNSFADQRLRSRLNRHFRAAASNWYLSDLGIARNGKALPLPPDLAASIWQHQVWRDGHMRSLHAAFSSDLLDIDDHAFSPLSDDSIDDFMLARLDRDSGKANGETGAPGLFSLEISVEAVGTIEAVYIAPYLLLIRDGDLIGVLGGSGRYDQIPADWHYLRP